MAVADSPPPLLPEKKEVKVKPTSVPIEAWYYNPSDEPPSSPHQYTPNRKVPIEHLIELGVLTWTQIETENFEANQFLNNIKKGRGYNYEEVLTVAPGKIPNFEANTKKFYTEHLHEQEEIRFILDGVGYEDVRDFDGRWIRIEIKKGDLIVLPPGMYHRFTLDSNQYLKALLLYQGQPCRTQFDQNPTTDVMEVRQEYLESVLYKDECLPEELGSSLEYKSLESVLKEDYLLPAAAPGSGLEYDLELVLKKEEFLPPMAVGGSSLELAAKSLEALTV